MGHYYWGMSVLLPVVAALFLDCWDQKEKKKFFFSVLVVEILTIGIAYLIRMREGSLWTCHEYLLCQAIMSITLSQGCAMLVMKRRITTRETLRAVCFICASVAVYSSLTYGQMILHSDMATATLLSKSQVAHHSLFPATWNYANGEIWTVGNNTFTFPYVFLLHNQSLARVLGSATYVLVTCLGICLISKKTFKNDSWLIAVPLFLVFLADGDVSHVLYEASYTGQMLWMVLGFTLVYQSIDSKKKWCMILYAFMAMVLSIGGSRFILEQSLPLLGAYVICWYIQERETEHLNWATQLKKLLGISALLMIPAIAGMVIHHQLAASHNMNDSVLNSMMLVDSLDTCWNNLIECFIGLFRCFGYVGNTSVLSIHGLGDMVSIISCGIVCFIVPILQGRRIKSESREVQMFYIFGLSHNALLIFASAIFGLITITTRYMLSTVFVFIVMSSRYIYVYWISQRNFRRHMWTTFFAMAAFMECLVLMTYSVNWNAAVTDRKAFNQKLLDMGLEKGYASYWNAYNNEVYSDLRIRYGAVVLNQGYASRLSWLVDEEVFTPSEGETFLLLSSEEAQMLGDGISAIFGNPVQTMEYKGIYVYVFDHDIILDMT